MVIIDGNDSILGRLATNIAKKLLEGEEVHLVNAENIVISGTTKSVFLKYLERRNLTNKQDPTRAPKWPKMPDMMVKRIIRGMLPIKKTRGREAFKKLRVYIGNPGYENPITIEQASTKKDNKNLKKFTTVKEVCKLIGWREKA